MSDIQTDELGKIAKNFRKKVSAQRIEIIELKARNKLLENKLKIAEDVIKQFSLETNKKEEKGKTTVIKEAQSPFVKLKKMDPYELFAKRMKELEKVPIDRHIKEYEDKMKKFRENVKLDDNEDVAILDPNLPPYMSLLMKQRK